VPVVPASVGVGADGEFRGGDSGSSLLPS